MTKYEHGIVFPVRLDNQGKPKYADILESVRASVESILSWMKYRRAFNIRYGSTTSYLWLPNVPNHVAVLSKQLRLAILDNDHRIEDVQIIIVRDKQKVFIEVTAYIINNQNLQFKIEL